MYGGRVIDDFDRRIVRVYMDEYMGEFLFDTFQPFHFYHDDNVDYKIPAVADTREDFIGEFYFYLYSSIRERMLSCFFRMQYMTQNIRTTEIVSFLKGTRFFSHLSLDDHCLTFNNAAMN